MKNLTYDVVERIAVELMLENGSTTSLEVKEKAREEDYWAVQSEVSRLLQQASTNNAWEESNNGMYNVYTDDSSDLEVEDDEQDEEDENASTGRTRDNVKTTWEAHSPGMDSEEFEDCTRSQARTRYANKHGISYSVVGARMIK